MLSSTTDEGTSGAGQKKDGSAGEKAQDSGGKPGYFALKAQDSDLMPEMPKGGCNFDFLNEEDLFDEDMRKHRKKSHTF